MDVQTLQTLGTLVNQIGLPATFGLIAIIAALNLLPVLADYLRAKVEVNKVRASSIKNSSGTKN